VYNLVERRRERVIDLVPHVRPHGIAFLDRRQHRARHRGEERRRAAGRTQSGKIERVIPTGGKLSHMIAVSPDRKRAYTANILSGDVSALDLETGALVKTVATGNKPEAIAVSPDGREVWVGTTTITPWSCSTQRRSRRSTRSRICPFRSA
jgi:YVTN family beta-propeller protein